MKKKIEKFKKQAESIAEIYNLVNHEKLIPYICRIFNQTSIKYSAPMGY